MAQEAIDIFSFNDPREYLRAVLALRKKRNRSFRLSAFAKDVGFASPSLLSMLLSGKRRLAPSAAEKLARSLDLTGKRKSYFLAMTHSQSLRSGPGEKQEAAEAMLLIKTKARKATLALDQYHFLTNWYYPVIYTLAGTSGVSSNPKSLAQRLGRGLTEAEVKTAITALENLGLLRREGEGYVRLAPRLVTDEDVRNVAFPRYHREMNRLAAEAISLPLEQREFNGLTVAIPQALLPTVKERIRKFRTELNEYLSAHETGAEDIFQMNIQLFPLTEPMGKGESV